MRPTIPKEIKEEIEKKGGLENILHDIPSKKRMKQISNMSYALSDETRLKILFFLYYQESCVCLIRDITGLAYSKLSYHLKILKDAGLIKSRKMGIYKIYSLSKKGKSIIDNCIMK